MYICGSIKNTSKYIESTIYLVKYTYNFPYFTKNILKKVVTYFYLFLMTKLLFSHI